MTLAGAGASHEVLQEANQTGLTALKTIKGNKAKPRFEYLRGWNIVNGMSQNRFKKFRESLKLERTGRFSGNEDAMTIIMPEVMFKISVYAEKFKVPFGLMFNRLKEVDKIYIDNRGKIIFRE
jgi:hypothetical protein